MLQQTGLASVQELWAAQGETDVRHWRNWRLRTRVNCLPPVQSENIKSGMVLLCGTRSAACWTVVVYLYTLCFSGPPVAVWCRKNIFIIETKNTENSPVSLNEHQNMHDTQTSHSKVTLDIRMHIYEVAGNKKNTVQLSLIRPLLSCNLVLAIYLELYFHFQVERFIFIVQSINPKYVNKPKTWIYG